MRSWPIQVGARALRAHALSALAVPVLALATGACTPTQFRRSTSFLKLGSAGTPSPTPTPTFSGTGPDSSTLSQRTSGGSADPVAAAGNGAGGIGSGSSSDGTPSGVNSSGDAPAGFPSLLTGGQLDGKMKICLDARSGTLQVQNAGRLRRFRAIFTALVPQPTGNSGGPQKVTLEFTPAEPVQTLPGTWTSNCRVSLAVAATRRDPSAGDGWNPPAISPLKTECGPSFTTGLLFDDDGGSRRSWVDVDFALKFSGCGTIP